MSAMRAQPGHRLEDARDDGVGHDPHQQGHEDDHRGLDEFREAVDFFVEFLFVPGPDLVKRERGVAGLLADDEDVDHQRRGTRPRA